MSTLDELGRYPHIEEFEAAAMDAWHKRFVAWRDYEDARLALIAAAKEVDRADMALIEARNALYEQFRKKAKP